METVLLEIAIIAVLIFINGIFSMSELSVVSARKVRLQSMADKGDRGAAVAIELAENPRSFLSTVQVGITLVGILAGAFGGATISQLLAGYLSTLPIIGQYGATLAFVIVVLVITYLSIVIGELIPKSFALSQPEKLAILVSRPMMFISRVASPIVWLLSTPTSAFLSLFKLRASVDPPVTDEEIIGLIDAGTKAGVFEETEQQMFESIIALENQPVTSIMTPRTEIAWIDTTASFESLAELLKPGRFSRMPVGEGSLDKILGYVSTKTLLGRYLDGKEVDVAAALLTPNYVPETVSILNLLKLFRDSHSHLAMVVDEHGGIEGLVTLHDVMESIVGELVAGQHAAAEGFVQNQPDGSYLIDGRLSVYEFQDLLGRSETPLDLGAGYDTVAGLVLSELGRIPLVKDRLTWRSYEMIVESMEGNRIREIRLIPNVIDGPNQD